MTEDYSQHNPSADTGMAGFGAYFSAIIQTATQLDPLVRGG
jgi:hypothetical protein